MSYSSLIIAKVNPFTQGNPDKNGKSPVILTIVAGKCPNRHVISGTVAESADMKVGKSYLMKVTEGKTDPEFGRRFNFTVLGEPTTMEIMQSVAVLGDGEIFQVGATKVADVAAEANVFQEAAQVTKTRAANPAEAAK